MRYAVLLIVLLTSCTVQEYGEVIVHTCPDCSNAYEGFSYCAFFDADKPFLSEFALVDEKNYLGIGTPIDISGYMHHKFCFNESHAVTGSANPTETGLMKNNNLVVFFESSTMARNFAIEYDYLLGNSAGFHTHSWLFNDRPITQLFCPRDHCEEHIVFELSKAQESITFLAFSFTSDPIGDLLIEKHGQGVIVQGVIEAWGATGRGGEFTRLNNTGIEVEKARTPGLMHHKAFVIDGRTAIFGSYNPTASANTKNRETVIITHEPTIVNAIQSEYESIIAQ